MLKNTFQQQQAQKCTQIQVTHPKPEFFGLFAYDVETVFAVQIDKAAASQQHKKGQRTEQSAKRLLSADLKNRHRKQRTGFSNVSRAPADAENVPKIKEKRIQEPPETVAFWF